MWIPRPREALGRRGIRTPGPPPSAAALSDGRTGGRCRTGGGVPPRGSGGRPGRHRARWRGRGGGGRSQHGLLEARRVVEAAPPNEFGGIWVCPYPAPVLPASSFRQSVFRAHSTASLRRAEWLKLHRRMNWAAYGFALIQPLCFQPRVFASPRSVLTARPP